MFFLSLTQNKIKHVLLILLVCSFVLVLFIYRHILLTVAAISPPNLFFKCPPLFDVKICL